MKTIEIYNTNIICNKCGRHIKSDEGFIPVKYGGITEHYPNCENPLKPEKTRQYMVENPSRQIGWEEFMYGII